MNNSVKQKSLIQRLAVILKNEKFLIIIFCLIVSFLILMITSRSSFMYPFNNWGDANAFFTMGKSLFNGKIIFKDIFEQKGPILYLIYGIGYLISNKTFFGIFILEVLSSTIFSYYIYKIITLFVDRKYAFILIPLFLSLLYSNVAFSYGGSCEEFCFPFIAYTIYQLLIFNRENINYKKMYIVGIMSGIIFLLKYTVLGVSFAFAIYIFIAMLVKKEYKKAFLLEIVFLLGMFTAFIPWLLYFTINDALFDFFNAYIFINASAYGISDTSILERIINCFYFFLRNLLGSGKHIFIIFYGIILFILNRKKVKKNDKIALVCLLFFSILFVYVGGTYLFYYVLPIIIFIIFSMIGWCLLIKKEVKIYKFVYLIVIAFSLSLSYFLTPNSSFIGKNRKDLPQYQFAEIINQKKDATILNYGFLDSGFYTVTGIVPNTKYFEKLNFNYDKFPEIVDSLNNYIEKKQVDFVVFIKTPTQNFPITKYLNINYEKIAEYKNDNYDNRQYILYKLKEVE